MHQPCRPLTFWPGELKGTKTVPYSRPSGLRILYARRTTVLILSAEITLTLVSEYSSTASVFSSCVDRGALTSACIHCGASPACAGIAAPSTYANATQPTTDIFSLIFRRCLARLQYHLFFIARPHHLKEIPKSAVILLVQQQDIHIQLPCEEKFPLVVFCLQRIQDDMWSSLILRRWQTAYLPAGWQRNGYIVLFSGRKIEINRVNPFRVFKHPLLCGAKNSDREQCSPSSSRNPPRNFQPE